MTRALAHSHPFLLQLNNLAGLISWTTDDSWESFLLLAAFWAVILYGDYVIRWAGPVIIAAVLLGGTYARRFSPLLTTGWGNERVKPDKNKDETVNDDRRQHKSLDEIVETLHVFTSRCDILLGPLLRLAEYMAMQPTGATSSNAPALVHILLRLLIVTPVWTILAVPPWRIITTQRTILLFGTLFLTWHARPAQVSRAVLWRSRTIRRVCAIVTGLDMEKSSVISIGLDFDKKRLSNGSIAGLSTNTLSATSDAKVRSQPTGIRFTFTLWENQRRWIGLGWTSSLFTYERGPWTDEHLSPVPPREEFSLPDVEDGTSTWRWVEGSEWRVEGAGTVGQGGDDDNRASAADRGRGKNKGIGEGGGWIYYDNKVCPYPASAHANISLDFTF